MRIINWEKFVIGCCALTLAASCSISTTMDAAIDKDIDAATKLREDAKVPTNHLFI